ncbi:MAG: hypothetical protein R3C44_12155, partial [Chloroflexota bacterium]
AAAIVRIPQIAEDPIWQPVYSSGPAVFYAFALWLVQLDPEIQQTAADRLHVRKATGEDLNALNALRDELKALPTSAAPSQIATVLRRYETRVLLAARILDISPEINEWLERYVREWQSVKTAVTGDDLRAIGLPSGPAYGRILDTLLAARLDGIVTSGVE